MALTSFGISQPARANGRFPQAQAILTVPSGDGSTVFLRTTFGILLSRDAGASWRWICERTLGYGGTWDPPIAVTRDGRLWVGLERGLVSTIDGCAVETSAELDGEQLVDLTTDAKGETLWALTGAPDKRGAVWGRLTSPGSVWTKLGLLPDDIHPMTLEVAPSNPSTMYVTAQPYGTVRGWLWRSDDGGKTFRVAKNDLAHTGPLFIAVVDSKDANRVVLRHLHTTGSTVLVTTDSGKTFRETLSMETAMFGFTKGADGKTLYAGSGRPADGIFRSTDRGEHFERVSNHGVLCLHDAPGGRLFICENPFTLGGSAIAVSLDRGRTVSSLATFADVRGPVACAAAPSLCEGAWPETLAQFLPREAGPPPATSAAPSRTSDAGGPVAAVAARRSCLCDAVGAPTTAPERGWVIAGGGLPLLAWTRMRRRRGSRRSHGGQASTT